MTHQIITVQIKQLRICLLCIAAPCIKPGAVDHISWDTCIVEGFDQRIIYQHILTSLLMLQLFDLFNQLLIVFIKRPAINPGLIDFSCHQAFPDKNLAGCRYIQWAIVNATFCLQSQAMQSRPLKRYNLHGLLFPMRFAIATPNQVLTDLFDPFRVHPGHATRKQTGRLGQFSRHNPFAGLLLQIRPGVHHKPDATRPEVIAFLF